MKVYGKTTKLRDKGNIYIRTGLSTQVIGKETCKKGREVKYGLMDQSTPEVMLTL
jgi:hypothetical protein